MKAYKYVNNIKQIPNGLWKHIKKGNHQSLHITESKQAKERLTLMWSMEVEELTLALRKWLLCPPLYQEGGPN